VAAVPGGSHLPHGCVFPLCQVHLTRAAGWTAQPADAWLLFSHCMARPEWGCRTKMWRRRPLRSSADPSALRFLSSLHLHRGWSICVCASQQPHRTTHQLPAPTHPHYHTGESKWRARLSDHQRPGRRHRHKGEGAQGSGKGGWVVMRPQHARG